MLLAVSFAAACDGTTRLHDVGGNDAAAPSDRGERDAQVYACALHDETFDAAPDALDGFSVSPHLMIASLVGSWTGPRGKVDVTVSFPAAYRGEIGNRPGLGTEPACGHNSKIALPSHLSLSTSDGKLDEQLNGDMLLAPAFAPYTATATVTQVLPAASVEGGIRPELGAEGSLSIEGQFDYGTSMPRWNVYIRASGASSLADVYLFDQKLP